MPFDPTRTLPRLQLGRLRAGQRQRSAAAKSMDHEDADVW